MVSRILRTAIFTALEGLVTLNSKVVPVYHKVPDGAVKPFIEIIGQSEDSDDGNKDVQHHDDNDEQEDRIERKSVGAREVVRVVLTRCHADVKRLHRGEDGGEVAFTFGVGGS